MAENPYDPKWSPKPQTPKVKTGTPKPPVYRPWNTTEFPSPYNAPANLPVWSGARDAADFAASRGYINLGVPAYNNMYYPSVPMTGEALPGASEVQQNWLTGYAPASSLGGNSQYSGIPYWQQTDEQRAATNAYWSQQANDVPRWDENMQAAYIQQYYGENGAPREGDPYQVFPYWKYSGNRGRANFTETYGFGNNVRPGSFYRTLENGRIISKGSPPASGKKPKGTETTATETLNKNVPSWVGSLVTWRT